MNTTALIYCENEFGAIDGKVANGLVRRSEKYDIVGVIDSTKGRRDTGEILDGIANGIPSFDNIDSAVEALNQVPQYFIYGIAPLSGFIDQEQRNIILSAMRKGMHIVNGLPQYFTADDEFVLKAEEYGVQLYDIRKPQERKDLHLFSGRIHEVTTPVIAVLGTDCAVGKRTTAMMLVQALEEQNIHVAFITTGQTGILQGSKYGVAIDVLSSGFATGEVEHAILSADKEEVPDLIIVEGQGALGHPAFTSSSAIIRGSVPDAVIIQHAPKREHYADYPLLKSTSLQKEINLIETFAKTSVIAIGINHEHMTADEITETIEAYETEFRLPTTDVLTFGCDKLVKGILEKFPTLEKSKEICLPLD
ncbi:MAG: DUF1611 domain-containing protein [Reichenbachiella sp.]|uniref:DUF1611 domain-containing protein n=1 Tax=Reichenbachiella sp. TaxID=2184521 RepID=UPI003263DDF0